MRFCKPEARAELDGVDTIVAWFARANALTSPVRLAFVKSSRLILLDM